MGLLSKLFKSTSSVQVNQPEGFYIVRFDYGEANARDLFYRANKGDVNAQLTLAKCFVEAGEQPYALPWYEKAAEGGSSVAYHELINFYEGRYVGVQADPVKADMVRNKSLSLNNPKTLLKLASQYHSGDGVEKNMEKAFEYYMKAAKLGNDEAMAEVGLCYLKGEGTKQDNTQAFAWLSRSNDRYYGYFNLAQCYLKGIGTSRDMEKATIYLEKAVNNKCLNLYEARTQLLDLYNKGYGGSNRINKMKQLAAEMGESDRLINDLAKIKL